MAAPRTRRVVLIGPECTGKTTLARRLATGLGAPQVEEASRRFAESHPGPLSALTVEPIATLGIAMQDAAVIGRPPLVILDTDLVSTVVYARHYYGACPAWIEMEAAARLADLYLLGLPDLPWVADGVRDRPTQREELLEAFREALRAFGAVVEEIGGQGEQRTQAALAALRKHGLLTGVE